MTPMPLTPEMRAPIAHVRGVRRGVGRETAVVDAAGSSSAASSPSRIATASPPCRAIASLAARATITATASASSPQRLLVTRANVVGDGDRARSIRAA